MDRHTGDDSPVPADGRRRACRFQARYSVPGTQHHRDLVDTPPPEGGMIWMESGHTFFNRCLSKLTGEPRLTGRATSRDHLARCVSLHRAQARQQRQWQSQSQS